jgi:hypothetical protein
VPANPGGGSWPKTRIAGVSASNRTQGIGVGDVNGDGWADVSGAYLGNDGKTKIAWWQNPGNGSPDWQRNTVGDAYSGYPDRIEMADVSGDGRLDIVVSDEDQPVQANYKTYWFEQPEVLTGSNWNRRTIATQYTTNSMDTADMDGDGDVDVITGEQKGTQQVIVWENLGNGTSWTGHVVSQGQESHLGTRAVDLDGDGDLDLVSIAWDEFQFIHLWRSDSVRNEP